MHITKMHGLGNDYIYLNGLEGAPEDLPGLAVRLSDRHFGVGGDGVICIRPGRGGDFTMEMYNADGSQGIMCGNGVRCVGKYVYDHGLVDKDKRTITVETLAGIKTLELEIEDGKAVSVTVDMGEAALTSRLPEDITVDGKEYRFVGINVGNPHAIYYVDQVDCLDLERIGPAFENHERFAPDRVNTEFIHVADRKHLEMRVWERGSGETWACGTGATASVMASILMGYTEDEAEVALRGGKLVIRYDRESGHLFMTGPAVEVFRGSIDIPEEIYYD